MYRSGIRISARTALLMAMAALSTWFTSSFWCRSQPLEVGESPPGGTFTIGIHHFSSDLSSFSLSEHESRFTYQNSLRSLKLSR